MSRMLSLRFRPCLTALFCAATLNPAAAQPADADRLKAEAAAAMQADDCATAAQKYDALATTLAADDSRRAERLTARFLAGVCYERLDRLADAADAYREVIYGDPPPALLERAQPRLAEIEPLVPVAVTFICDEPGLTIRFEAVPDGSKPCEEAWQLAAGIYRGEAVAPDGRSTVLTVRVTPGLPEEVVVLMPAAAGRKLVAPPVAESAPVESKSRVLAWTLTGASAATLAAGVAFNVVGRAAVDEGDAAYLRFEQARAVRNTTAMAAARDDVEAARADAEAARLTSYVLLGAGVALAGAALWTWFEGPGIGGEAGQGSDAGSGAGEGGGAGAWLMPGGAGLSVGGSW